MTKINDSINIDSTITVSISTCMTDQYCSNKSTFDK